MKLRTVLKAQLHGSGSMRRHVCVCWNLVRVRAMFCMLVHRACVCTLIVQSESYVIFSAWPLDVAVASTVLYASGGSCNKLSVHTVLLIKL